MSGVTKVSVMKCRNRENLRGEIEENETVEQYVHVEKSHLLEKKILLQLHSMYIFHQNVCFCINAFQQETDYYCPDYSLTFTSTAGHDSRSMAFSTIMVRFRELLSLNYCLSNKSTRKIFPAVMTDRKTSDDYRQSR